MKGRMKKIASLVLAFVLCAGSVLNVGAVTIDEAEKKADKLESEKKAAEAEKKALAEKLNKIIKQRNQTEEELTQKEVADKLGISQSYISRLEKKIMRRLKKEMIRLE